MTIRFRAKTQEGWVIDSPLTAFKFPAGEVHIKGVDSPQKFRYQIADVRGMNHEDLITLMMWDDAVVSRGERGIVFLPYLPGARADRGLPFGASIYAHLIASLEASQVIVLDPHSDVWVEEWKTAIEGWNEHHGYAESVLTEFPFERIIKREVQDGSSDSKPMPYDGVIAPDKGAVDRATRAARVMGVPVYTAGKTRDFETGQLTGFHMEDELPEEGRFLIVDDICDGGGTFIGLAKAIYGADSKTDSKIRLDLWVTHGVFSKGLREFPNYFDTIHTTNSYADREELFRLHITDHDVHDLTNEPFLRLHDITPYMYEAISV